MATASLVASWLLVEVPGSWGRDAVGHSALGPHAPAVWREAMKRRGIRVIAIRRDLDRGHESAAEGLRLVHVVAPRPGGMPSSAHRLLVGDLSDVVSATETLAAGSGVGTGWTPDVERYILVCTNGRHDACCATFGRPLVRWLRASAWAEQVWECSHIGGDRFAGNIVLLPDSLYYGRCDRLDAERLLVAREERRLDLRCFRGRSTFRWPEQAAEHFARAELGLDGIDAVTGATVLDDDGGLVRISLIDGSVDVGLERSTVRSPTPLTCSGPAGSTYPAFRLVDLRRR